MHSASSRAFRPSRRATVLGGLGAAAGATLSWAGAGPARAASPEMPRLAPVPPLPPGAPVRTMFTPLEQRFGSYLTILPPMTNDIVDDPDPETYGFMAGGWQRTPIVPYNARIQEHTYTLAWYLTHARDWNPYFGSVPLRDRLDAALGHYLRLQHPDGSWPERRVGQHGKAATGFGIGYLAKTLQHLRSRNQLPSRQRDIEAALRKAINWSLGPDTGDWGEPGGPVRFANQNSAGLAGATKALTVFKDADLQRRLLERISYIAEFGQSPAGFFYEPTGMDINYNFEVMLPEIAEIYLLTGNKDILSMARKFSEWFGYNLLREPDDSGWLTYYAMSARTSVSFYDNVIPDPDRSNLGSFFVPDVPSLGAFFTSRQDRAATRRAWSREPGPAPGLTKLDTSPRILAHAEYGERLPSNGAKKQALRDIPYLASRDFALIRADRSQQQSYVYVRQPGLYFGGFFGKRPSTTVRTGTGFLWHPQAGTIVHAGQTDQNSWATVLPAGTSDAHSDLDATYRVGDRDWDGSRVVPRGAPVRVDYQLPDGRIKTALTVRRNSVSRSVRATTAVTEQVPLVLHPTDIVSLTDRTPVRYGQDTAGRADGLIVRRGANVIRIEWGKPLTVTVSATSTTYLRDARRRVHVLHIPHDGALTTTIVTD